MKKNLAMWMGALLLSVASFACSSSSSTDATTETDTGVTAPPDTGVTTRPDSGVTTPDTGPKDTGSPADTGTPPPDSGAPPPDAGTPDLGPAGGPLAGPADMHCAGPNGMDGGITIVDPAACTPPDAGAGVDVGTSTACAFGPTNFNTHAIDDDCKYDVNYSVTPIYKNQDVTFTVHAKRLSDGLPLQHANTLTEIFVQPTDDPCNATHAAPNAPTMTTETGTTGTYVIGPVRFDVPGRWTVRFHFREDCYDTPASPHGHAGFFINVP